MQKKPDNIQITESNKATKEGWELFMKGKYSEAILSFCISIQIHPTYSAYAGWGLSLYDQGKYDQAIEKYEKSLALQANPKVYFNLGLVYFNQEKYEKAIEYYEKAVSIDANVFHFYFNIGLALSKLNRNDEAMQMLLKGMEMLKEDPVKKNEEIKINENFIKVADDSMREIELQMKHLQAKKQRVNQLLELIQANSEEDLQNIVYEKKIREVSFVNTKDSM